MVLANLSDGTTAKFDLTCQNHLSNLNRLAALRRISALAILQGGTQHTLTPPRRFREEPVYGAEALVNTDGLCVGERVFAQVGPFRVSLTATFKSKLVRCDLVRVGRMQYNATHRRQQ